MPKFTYLWGLRATLMLRNISGDYFIIQGGFLSYFIIVDGVDVGARRVRGYCGQPDGTIRALSYITRTSVSNRCDVFVILSLLIGQDLYIDVVNDLCPVKTRLDLLMNNFISAHDRRIRKGNRTYWCTMRGDIFVGSLQLRRRVNYDLAVSTGVIIADCKILVIDISLRSIIQKVELMFLCAVLFHYASNL